MLAQQLGYFLGMLSASHVYDGRAFHASQDMDHLAPFVITFSYDIGQVLAFKAHSEHIGLSKFELLHDVLYHFGSGSGSKS